jgi:protein-S-isoprenylcysteine O-methyltransferase Ste14
VNERSGSHGGSRLRFDAASAPTRARPEGRSSGNGRILRQTVVGLGLIAWLIALPLVHGVLPWVLSSLTIRYGWTRGRPGIWNLLGLLPVAIGAAGLIWVLALGLARIRELPGRMQGLGSPYLMTRGPYAFTRNPMYVGELALWFGWTILFGSAALLLALVTLLVQAPFVRPDNSRMEHRRAAECGLYLTGNSQLSYKRTELFPRNLPVI